MKHEWNQSIGSQYSLSNCQLCAFSFSWIIVLGLSTRADVHGPKNTGWTKAVTRRSYHDVVNHHATIHCSSSWAGKAVELLDLLTAWWQPTDLQWHYVHPPSSNTDKELYAHHLGPKWPCSKLSRLCLNGFLIVFLFFLYYLSFLSFCCFLPRPLPFPLDHNSLCTCMDASFDIHPTAV